MYTYMYTTFLSAQYLLISCDLNDNCVGFDKEKLPIKKCENYMGHFCPVLLCII